MTGVWETGKRGKRDKGKYEYVRAAAEKRNVRSESEDASQSSDLYDIRGHKRASAEDDKLLDKLQRPYFFRTPRPGEREPLENYSESADRDANGRKNVKLMHLASDNDLQQLAVRGRDKKSIFLAASSESPSKAAPSADMRHFEKSKSRQMFSQGTTSLFSMGGKQEGAAALELESPKKWSVGRLKPFVESEKSLMLANMLPFAGSDHESAELMELQNSIGRIRAEMDGIKKLENSNINSLRHKEILSTLAGIEGILEIRIKRLNEIIMKKDYARRRMQQRLTFVAGLLDEIRIDSGDFPQSGITPEQKPGEDEDGNKKSNYEKEKDGGNA